VPGIEAWVFEIEGYTFTLNMTTVTLLLMAMPKPGFSCTGDAAMQ
jgi:hypothetical protein